MGSTEEERLAALAAYGVLDTSPEAAFDELAKLAKLAAELCDTPMALVSFVDRDRQWFKSSVGVDATETPRAISFCSHAIDGEGPFVVTDARTDERFAQNPLVTGPMSLQFYAGIPLVDENDAALGTLCVLDTRPRVLSPLQLNALRVLAKQLLAQLEVRKLLVREKSLRAEVELAHRRAAFLADAAALLAASLATDRTLEAVARLAVRDDGRGITADLLPDVFEQFRQDEHGVGRRMGGLGLGLAIAKHIVTAVGGTISAHSDGEGKGASFIVTLPLSLTTSGPAPALAAPTDVIFEGAASLLGARVLVVDDDADTRSVLAELLSANGAEVSTAESAEDGFEVFRRERPDVIVSDVMMGGASGYDLVRRVRDLPPQDGGRTPALALTGNTSTADRTSALAAGFHFYLPKPIDPNELLTVVAALRAGDAP